METNSGMASDPVYTGYKRVAVPMFFVDNGQGAGYLKLMFPDGTFIKVWPEDNEDVDVLYQAMQYYLNTLSEDNPGG